jgi:hypothetical protein
MLKQIMLVLTLVSCAPKPDCPNCPDNPAQPVPPNPPAPPSPPAPPNPPVPPPVPEPTDKTLVCGMIWDLEGEPEGRFFNVNYTVTFKKNKETFASLKTSYEYDGEVIEGSEANKLYPADKANMAEVSTFVWQASLLGNIAKIKNNALNQTKEVTCI